MKKTCFRIINIWIFIMVYYAALIAREESDTLKFIHISDTHFCNLDGYHPFFVEKRQHFGNVAGPLSEFFKVMPGKLGSDFIVITGDMIDYYEAETHIGSMMATQIEQFTNLVDDCNFPIYMALGNHDIASYWVNDNTSYSTNQINAVKARAQWVKNVSCFKNGTYYSRVFQVDTTTYRLIFLDNGYYSPDWRTKGTSSNIIDKYQLLWLDDQLKQSDHDVEIIFTHIPLFRPDPNDLSPTRNTYFLDKNDTVAIEYEPQKLHNDRDTFDLWSVLEENGSAKVFFTGHNHSSVNHNIKFSDDYSIHQIMIGSFGYDSRNWRLIKLTDNKILVSFPGDRNVQYTIEVD